MNVSVDRTIRGYALTETIGVGPYSTVHRGLQPGLNRQVAIKIILPEHANLPAFIRRFEADCQLVARLNHPNIVALYDYWREPDGAFLIMPCFPGNLESLLADAPLPLEQVIPLIEEITDALAVAHRSGVIHGDLKPANILLDTNRHACLTDFGIIHYGDSLPDAAAPSPYRSPEQANNGEPGVQADVYSLGALIYHLLTGQAPPPAHERLGDGAGILASLRAYQPTLPEVVEDVVRQAIALDPAERYPDVLSLVDAFQAAVAGPDAAGGAAEGAPSELETAEYAASTALDRFVKGGSGIRWRFEQEIVNPYKGLLPFEPPDADDFFGRETLTQTLLHRLEEGGEYARFLAVVGPSGSGKSSVVKAGLLVGLRQGALPGSNRWLIAEMTPKAHPLEELLTALLSVASQSLPDIMEQLEQDEHGLTRVVTALFPEEEVLLVIDQFEEVFTLSSDLGRARHFLDLVHAAVMAENSRVRVIVTLRADFYDRPLMYPNFSDLVANRTEAVSPLSPTELERAIVGPLERVGITWDPKLVSTIVAEVKDQPGTLPMLQYALTELFERRVGYTVTMAAYQEIGGILGSLTKRVDEVYDGLSAEQQSVTRQLFLRLTTLGEGTEDTRRQALQSELLSLGGGTMQDVIDIFGRSRLLTFDHDSVTREPTIEVAHEAIIREWKRLRTWLDESRDDLRQQRRLALATHEWQSAGQDPSFLAAGTRLDQLEGWYENTALSLSQPEREYIQASLAERDVQRSREAERQAREAALEARAQRNLRIVAIVSTAAGILAVLLTIFAFIQANAAQKATILSQEAAETSSELAVLTNAQLSLYRYDNTDLAIALALEGQRRGNLPDQEVRVLTETMYAPGTRRVFTGSTDRLYRNDLSPDGTQVLAGGHDTVVRLYDVQSGELLREYEGHTDEIMDLAFSPDASIFASASRDETVRIWDVNTGDVLRTLEGVDDFMAVEFSPDGTLLATGALDDTTRLWNAETGELIATFGPDDPETEEVEGHQNWVWGVSFSPDGKDLFSAGEEGLILRWRIEDGALVQSYGEGQLQHAYDVYFTPDGQTMLAATFKNEVPVWDVESGELRYWMKGHTASVMGIDLSSDGQTVMTASQDMTVRRWNLATGAELHRFVGHSDRVYDVEFLPGERQFITSSYDSTLRLWDIETDQMLRRLEGHESTIYQVVFNAEGTVLASTSRDQTVRLWDVATGELLQVLGPDDPETDELEGHDDRVISAAFSPDGRYLLSAGLNSYILLWDLESGEIIQVIEPDDPATEIVEGHKQTVDASVEMLYTWYVTFSADGRYAYSAAFDKTVIKWDLESGEVLQIYEGHTQGVLGVTLLSDGKHFLTHSWDGTVILWDEATGEIVRRYEGHTNWIWSISLSPDEKTFISASADNSMIQWDLETGRPVHYFLGHEDSVLSVAFSIDGLFAVSSGRDNRVALWNVQTGEWLRNYGGHTNWVRSVAYSPVEDIFATGDNDGAVFLWERQTLDEMVAWAHENRFVRDLTCEERGFYRIEPLCDETGALVEDAG